MALLTALAVVVAGCGAGDESGASLASTLAPTHAAAGGSSLDPHEAMWAALDLRHASDPEVSLFSRMAESGDPTYIPVLVELYLSPVGFRFYTDEIVEALQRLTGESYTRAQWAQWVKWLGRHGEIEPPQRFDAWKSEMLQAIDPAFGTFLFEGVGSRIRLEEIVWGGVLKDAVPDLRRPPYVPAAAATYLAPGERVFGVSINGEHRAYPLRIMNAHEMANDVLGGEPIALAYCTLCGAGIVYSTRVPEIGDEPIEFGTSGLLYRSNKLMYDRTTRSLWQQFLGEPVVGELAGSSLTLARFPIVLTTWGEWRAQHPDTGVLSLETGVYPDEKYLPEGEPGSVYQDYLYSPDTLFPVWLESDALPTKEQVLGVVVGGVAKAYSLRDLARTPVVTDAVGPARLTIVTDPFGGGARAYQGADVEFLDTLDGPPGARTIMDREGRTWLVTEEALVSEDRSERRLPRVPGHTAFWFGWYSNYPNSLVYRPAAAPEFAAAKGEAVVITSARPPWIVDLAGLVQCDSLEQGRGAGKRKL